MRQLLLAGLLTVPAGAVDFEASGYLKNLYQLNRTGVRRAKVTSDLTRARVSLGASHGSVRVHVDYDHELRFGTLLRSADFRQFGLGEPPSHFNLAPSISSGPDVNYRHRLYRGWIQARLWDVRLRFGRQRIAWGTAKLWNPVDVLNPYQPTSVEREERRGVDALHVRRGVGDLGQIEAAYTLSDRWAGSDLLGRIRGSVGGTDLSVLGGHVAGSTGSWMVGGAWSSNLKGGNFHGEWSYVDLVFKDPFFRGVVGYEYTFSADPFWTPFKDVWWVFEYLYNGRGPSDPRFYDLASLATGREVSLARNYIGTGITKELHPLVKAEFYSLYNLDDQSHFVAPSISYNPIGELHLSTGWQRFGGTPNSEYGRLGNLFFAQAQWFW